MIPKASPVILDGPVLGENDGLRHHGLGDVQVGFKYRFAQEGDWTPQMAIYPQVRAPTGRDADGLGAGHWRVLLPLWLQKGFGAWTTCGGGGWWKNPGLENHDYWFFGWQIQRELSEETSLDFELFKQSSSSIDQPGTTAFNAGFQQAIWNKFQFIGSAGRVFQGQKGSQFFIGLRGSF